eukprot:4549145-Amphidinium_carterae.1
MDSVLKQRNLDACASFVLLLLMTCRSWQLNTAAPQPWANPVQIADQQAELDSRFKDRLT